MSTPMKQGSSQQGHGQGRTPSQFHAAVTPSFMAATPPGSTPFASTPRGHKASPQALKKASPATTASLTAPPGPSSAAAALNFDSPSVAAAMGALGIADYSIDGVAAGMQALGPGAPAGLRSDDDFAKKLDAIIELLGKKKGMVSEEGLERLVKKAQFECMWEESTNNDRKRKTLVIAGKKLQLEIAMENHIVMGASISFPMSTPLLTKHDAKAGRIIYDDLKLDPAQSPLIKTLDKFAANIERLAELDRLSILPAMDWPGLDCYEAPVGIYESLEKLYQWDLASKRRDLSFAGASEYALRNAVMCTGHGRPVMNDQGKLGLSLQYWKDEWIVRPRDEAAEEAYDERLRFWSILVGCTPLNGALYPPVRLSTAWISDGIEKMAGPVHAQVLGAPPPAAHAELDWLEPEPTFLPPEAGGDAGVSMMQPDGTMSIAKYPNVMFKAVFDPPLIVPQGVSMMLHGLTGTQPNIFPWPTYDGLVFPLPPNSGHVPGELRKIVFERTAQQRKPADPTDSSGGDDEWEEWEERCRLYVVKGVYAHRLSEMPFSHPRQLVEMMPTLRQYALLARILEKTFGIEVSPAPEKGDPPAVRSMSGALEIKTLQDDLFNIVGRGVRPPPAPGPFPRGKGFDATLTVHPVPRIQLVFPVPSSTEPGNVMFEIRPNGVVAVVAQNITPTGENGRKGVAASATWKGRPCGPDGLAKRLQVCDDLGWFCEWVRTRLG